MVGLPTRYTSRAYDGENDPNVCVFFFFGPFFLSPHRPSSGNKKSYPRVYKSRRKWSAFNEFADFPESFPVLFTEHPKTRTCPRVPT